MRPECQPSLCANLASNYVCSLKCFLIIHFRGILKKSGIAKNPNLHNLYGLYFLLQVTRLLTRYSKWPKKDASLRIWIIVLIGIDCRGSFFPLSLSVLFQGGIVAVFLYRQCPSSAFSAEERYTLFCHYQLEVSK